MKSYLEEFKNELTDFYNKTVFPENTEVTPKEAETLV